MLKIGEFYGFDISVKAQHSINMGVDTYENKFYVFKFGSSIHYTHNNGTMPRTPELAGDYSIKALDKIETLLEKHNGVAQELKNDLNSVISVEYKEFPKKGTTIAIEQEIKNLTKKIENGIGKHIQTDNGMEL